MMHNGTKIEADVLLKKIGGRRSGPGAEFVFSFDKIRLITFSEMFSRIQVPPRYSFKPRPYSFVSYTFVCYTFLYLVIPERVSNYSIVRIYTKTFSVNGPMNILPKFQPIGSEF